MKKLRCLVAAVLLLSTLFALLSCGNVVDLSKDSELGSTWTRFVIDGEYEKVCVDLDLNPYSSLIEPSKTPADKETFLSEVSKLQKYMGKKITVTEDVKSIRRGQYHSIEFLSNADVSEKLEPFLIIEIYEKNIVFILSGQNEPIGYELNKGYDIIIDSIRNICG